MQAIDAAHGHQPRQTGQHARLLRRRHAARQRAGGAGGARRATRSPADAADHAARLHRHRRARPVRRRAVGGSCARRHDRAKGGLLKGSELAHDLRCLRANDLVWNYVVGNYLKGETPPPFDLLYWNGDDTNLPGPMFCWYLRNTYLREQAARAGHAHACAASRSTWRRSRCRPTSTPRAKTTSCRGRRAYASARSCCSGNDALRARRHRPHRRRDQPAGQEQAQLLGRRQAAAPTPRTGSTARTEQPGSWWPDWAAWLKAHAGKLVAAPKTPGNRKYKAIEPAPGRYVKAKA